MTSVDLLEENEKVELLIDGYTRSLTKSLSTKVPRDINKTIQMYSWNISQHSMKRIAAAHLIASIINDYINAPENMCPFSDNKDLNILQYIYVRGGALRDAYLLRNIKDIDIVINIHQVSKQYLNHLSKYHSNTNIDDDIKDPDINSNCKCIFYRHYLNKYKDWNDRNSIHSKIRRNWFPNKNKIGKGHTFSTNDENVDKILNFESHIVNADYLINARFIVNILYHSKLYSRNIKISSRYFGHHWVVKLKSYGYHGVQLRDISFDIVDQTGNTYGRYQTFKEYKHLNGSDNIDDTVLGINEYDDKQKKKNICVPIYPFPMNVVYYGFTINSIHIDLYNVLENNTFGSVIDYNWNNKIKKKYNNEIVNKYNIIGLSHLKEKLLICPSLDVINKVTANFYFWRLIKTAQKFIHKIENGIWKIDTQYLQLTIKHYHLWFDDAFITKDPKIFNAKFINKFLKWDIMTQDDYMDRFRVFKYIGFDQYFVDKINKYPLCVKQPLEKGIKKLKPQAKRMFIKKCFQEFGYPDIECK